MIQESSATFERNKAEFALELAFFWLRCLMFPGEANACQAECRAQNHRSSTSEVRGKAQPREDRGGDRHVEGRRDEFRAPGGHQPVLPVKDIWPYQLSKHFRAALCR
ncbi:MAG: hypothetical protein ACREFP_00685 [Acetobacteraceae bacterium]